MSISSTFLFSVSGLQAAQRRSEVSANNLANVSTPGFKAQRALQSDLRTGGTQVKSIDTLNTPGPILRTGNRLDLAVAGEGYFQVRDGDGVAYTRDGGFHLDADGQIVDAGGRRLSPEIQVPDNAQAVEVSSNGSVNAVLADGTREPIGQIELARFANSGGLFRQGDNLLTPTANSGAAQAGAPGQGGLGTLLPQGTLEGSNVSIEAEIINQIVYLRSFQANVRPIQAADEMLGELLDIRQ